MKITLIIFLTIFLSACSNKSDIDSISAKNPELKRFVDSLKNTSLIYKKCKECKINGLEGKQFIGFTDRYPPKGNYDKKEVEIGDFEYDSYQIFEPENTERAKGKLYLCYFNQIQREKFIDFAKYYENRIGHYKQLCSVKYFNNVTIIRIENPDF